MADKILNRLLAATAQAEWPDKMITTHGTVMGCKERFSGKERTGCTTGWRISQNAGRGPELRKKS